MKASELKEKFLAFFVEKGHKVIPNVSLVPENDSSTLFISAGMQPLVPYLLGETHPLGSRLCSLQRCLRTGDINCVGDVFHNTFFEMLGNWSLGDYWKEEALSWSLEFLTKNLGLESSRLHVTIFAGDKNAPRDVESEKIWHSLGIPPERIYPLPKEDNWWEAGKTGPGGPDSEIFYDLGTPPCGSNCHPGDGCGRFAEMWNNVFMEYNRMIDGRYEKLQQRNVDTGMGVERSSAVLQGKKNVFDIDVFLPIMSAVEAVARQSKIDIQSKRIIADHIRAAVFLLGDGVEPANKDRGYVLRRLIRRAVFKLYCVEGIGSRREAITKIANAVFEVNASNYQIFAKPYEIIADLGFEVDKFEKTLSRGMKFLEKQSKLNGPVAFNALQTYGIPFDVTCEYALSKGQEIIEADFQRALKDHQEKSRQGARQKFAGGLADHSKEATRFHTVTHLLHQALRDILGSGVRQIGSNITSNRLRFDFSYPQKITKEEIDRVEEIVNEKITDSLPVKMEMMPLSVAKEKGALAFFTDRYSDKVKVYSIGNYSKEVCGGPHVSSTKEIGRVKIVKEESVGAGKRRIYAQFA